MNSPGFSSPARRTTRRVAPRSEQSGGASGQALTGPVQPMRSSVPMRVDRGTLNDRHTDALLAPASRAAVICSIVSASMLGGRPPRRPRRRAATKPAITRSRVSARSYWASAPKSENSNSPWGVLVSICSVSDRKATPRFFRSVMIARRLVNDRPRRSSFQTTKVSPAFRNSRQVSCPPAVPRS